MSYIDQLFKFFKRCPGCGAASPAYCPRCWFELNGAGVQEFTLVACKPFLMRAIWIWRDWETSSGQDWVKRSDILRNSILMSKGRPQYELVDLWASEMCYRAGLGGHLRDKRDWLIVTPPSSSARPDGHTRYMAKELSRLTDIPYFDGDLFERVATVGQKESTKTMSRSERMATEVRLDRNISKVQRDRICQTRGFLMIDDVIASGSTAMAVWRALGRPIQYEAWAVTWKIPEFE